MRRAGIAALPLTVAAFLVGCPFGGTPQKDMTNVPPPPLTKPRGEYRQQVYAVADVSTANPAPVVRALLATEDNGLGKALYESVTPVLRRRALDRLARVQRAALAKSASLVVLDAGRSRAAQEALAALVGDPRFAEVPKPEDGGPDVRGAAVDVTLELTDELGQHSVDMGTEYMQVTLASLRGAEGLGRDVLDNRALLDALMAAEGFEKGAAWWDYHDPDWRDFPELGENDYAHRLIQRDYGAMLLNLAERGGPAEVPVPSKTPTGG